MENTKVMFLTNDDVHIIGYTQYPIPEETPEGCYVVDEPSQDLLENYMRYKIVDGVPVKMADEEYDALYPTPTQEPSEMEILGQRITDTELDAMESNQRITDLELFQLEGGASNV